MAGSKDLFILVKSLSKVEKAYFLKFCGLQKGEKNYLKVYKEMVKMDNYDEEKVIKKYKNETFVKSIHVTRNYLYKQILKSMRAGRVNDLIDTKLSNLLIDASTLELKGLYEQSFRMLKKARGIAVEYSKLPFLLEIIKRQINHVINIKTKGLYEAVDELYQEAIVAVGHHIQEWQYYELNHRMFSMYRKGPEISKRQSGEILNELISDEVLSSFPEDGSFYSRYLFHNIHAINDLIQGNYENAKLRYESIVSIWEANPGKVKEKTQLYKIHLSNYLNCLSRLREYEQFPVILDRIESLGSRSFDEEAETFQNLYHLKLLYYLNTEQFKEGKNLEEPIEEGFVNYKTKINKARKITLCYNMTILFFALEEYDKALDWLGKIIHDQRSEVRQDMQRFARILELIFHFELGNEDVLDFFYRSTIRTLRRKSGLSEYEEKVLSSLHAIFFAIDKRERREKLEAFEDELDKLKSSKVKMIGYEELMIWIENKLG